MCGDIGEENHLERDCGELPCGGGGVALGAQTAREALARVRVRVRVRVST